MTCVNKQCCNNQSVFLHICIYIDIISLSLSFTSQQSDHCCNGYFEAEKESYMIITQTQEVHVYMYIHYKVILLINSKNYTP